jgi:hypothetical protein
MSHPTLHDKAAESAMLVQTIREVLKEPGNAVRNIALCTEALVLHKKNSPPALASGSTRPTPHSVKAPVADRGLGGED